MSTPPPSPDAAPPADPELLDAAVRFAREAGELTLGHFRDVELHVEHKGDGTPVTIADREAESLLRQRIGDAFPEDAVVGEEHDDTTGTSGRTWVLDPIDGTKAFSCGVGTYSNLVCVCDEHGPAVGVVNLPALGETVAAGRGLGCTLNGAPVHADGPATRRAPSGDDRALAGRVLCVSGMHGWTPEMFARVQDAGVELRTWGDAYGHALVATGRVSAMFDPYLAWWDLAALVVVMSEAGATLTRRDGDPAVTETSQPEPYPYSAISSTGPEHELWVEILR